MVLSDLIDTALREFGTGLEGRYGLSTTGDTTFSLRGETRDGRTFRGTGRIYLDGPGIRVEFELDVEGTIDVGPVPDFLDKAGKLLEEFSAQSENEHIRSGRQFGALLKHIADWHAGKPVDKKILRSLLRFTAKQLEDLQHKAGVPKGHPLDEARKAVSAAARLLKD